MPLNVRTSLLRLKFRAATLWAAVRIVIYRWNVAKWKFRLWSGSFRPKFALLWRRWKWLLPWFCTATVSEEVAPHLKKCCHRMRIPRCFASKIGWRRSRRGSTKRCTSRWWDHPILWFTRSRTRFLSVCANASLRAPARSVCPTRPPFSSARTHRLFQLSPNIPGTSTILSTSNISSILLSYVPFVSYDPLLILFNFDYFFSTNS